MLHYSIYLCKKKIHKQAVSPGAMWHLGASGGTASLWAGPAHRAWPQPHPHPLAEWLALAASAPIEGPAKQGCY